MRGIARGSAMLLELCWREDKRKTVIAVTLMLLGGAAAPLVALALKVLTDAAVAGQTGAVTAAGIAVAVLLLAAHTLSHFAHIAYFELSELNELTVSDELIQLANGSPGLAHHEQSAYADKLAVLSQEMQELRAALQALLSSGGLALGLVATAVLLVRLNPVLLALPALAAPPLLAGRWAHNRLDRAKEAAAEDIRRARHLVRAATRPGPVKELRVFGLEHEVRTRHHAHWHATTRRLWRAHRSGLLLRTAGQLVFAAGYLGAVLLVVSQAIQGRSTIGDVVLVIALAAQVNQQTAQAVSLLHDLQAMAKALGRLRWLRDLVASHAPAAPERPIGDRIQTGIRFEGVRFRYPGTDHAVLNVGDLELPAGSTVALVGENGAGKTTLVKLLCRFYDPTEGRITLDGVDLRSFDVERWRERIATGFQDFARLELLAREAIGVGDLPHIDDDDAVQAALQRAQVHDVIDGLPDGLATQLGKSYADGAELSGGQWQKLALARAMMRSEPLLLILDEPTAALDAEAEHALFERYAETAKRASARTGAITALVSHRFSTVRMADLILVVAGGEITEMGTHDDLVALGGLYAELYELQAASYR